MRLVGPHGLDTYAAAAETKSKCKISKISQKIWKPNFENLFRSFFLHIDT